jgi:hypothetical protein
MKTIMRRTVTGCLLSAAALSAGSAHAYNWKTHVRLVETAAQIMQPSTFPTGTPAPSGVDANAWAQYLTAIHNAIGQLGVLKTGLPNAGSENSNTCNYNLNDNMSEIPNVRIVDSNYLPLQGGQVIGGDLLQNAGHCSETQIGCTADDALRVGRILGWQGASADDRERDTTIWVRPTSVAFLGAAESLASEAFDFTTGALLLPFVCAWDWLTGSGCSLNQATQLASSVDPVTQLNGLVPGWDIQNDYTYVGFWHFVDAAAGSGRYNPTARGLFYENAGPTGIPGAIDVGIMLAGDLGGLALDADSSDGVSRYGQYDQTHRNKAEWQAPTIGHVEYSPISNMAKYGWDQYFANPNTALPLSWPLHAFGDACEPQHAAGSTGWGHRPYEDEVDNLLDSQLLPPPLATCTLAFLQDPFATPPSDPAQSARILQIGFNFWNKYHGQFGAGLPVQAMVIDVAQQTFAAASQSGIYTVGSDIASVDWQVGDHNVADNQFSSDASAMKPLLELGSGAIIAFLAAAGPAANPMTAADSHQECTGGAQFDFPIADCGAPPPPPQFTNANNTICTSGTCTDAGLACPPASQCSETVPCTGNQFCSSGCCFTIPK